jgi:transcriptional regulator
LRLKDPKNVETHKMTIDIGKTIDSPEMIDAAITSDVASPPDEMTTDRDDDKIKVMATTVVMMTTALQMKTMIAMNEEMINRRGEETKTGAS